MAAVGLVRAPGAAHQPAEALPFYLWPEHVPTYKLWLAVRTQWRYAGMDARPTGLDYTALGFVMAHQVPPRRRAQRLAEIQLMEGAALDAWGEKRAAEAR